MSRSLRRRTLVLAAGSVLLLILAWGAREYALRTAKPALPEFHGQFGQDRWIVCTVFPGVSNGYFVDIGSGDGVRSSNSKALEDLGWTGVAIDPFPTNWEGRTCRLFKEVVYGRKGEVVEFRVADTLGGIDKHIDAWRESVRSRPVVKLTTTTIGDILERAGAPSFLHYVSLDTEGSEYEILSAFPFAKYRVGAFTIEHNLEDPKRTKIRDLLAAHGYRCANPQEVEDWYLPVASK
jgi:hypothetical protein